MSAISIPKPSQSPNSSPLPACDLNHWCKPTCDGRSETHRSLTKLENLSIKLIFITVKNSTLACVWDLIIKTVVVTMRECAICSREKLRSTGLHSSTKEIFLIFRDESECRMANRFGIAACVFPGFRLSLREEQIRIREKRQLLILFHTRNISFSTF